MGNGALKASPSLLSVPESFSLADFDERRDLCSDDLLDDLDDLELPPFRGSREPY